MHDMLSDITNGLTHRRKNRGYPNITDLAELTYNLLQRFRESL